jgi:hypothetical protein
MWNLSGLDVELSAVSKWIYYRSYNYDSTTSFGIFSRAIGCRLHRIHAYATHRTLSALLNMYPIIIAHLKTRGGRRRERNTTVII